MALTKKKEKVLLVGLLIVMAILIMYRFATSEKPRTAPLTYAPGAVATSPVRKGLAVPGLAADPLLVLLERREEKYPGVKRDIFRMENPLSAKQIAAAKIASLPKTLPTPTIVLPPPPPEKTPEELAAEMAKADLAKFRFLGYLKDKDNTLFLSKDGELFIVKSGDTVVKTYKVKESGKDFVVVLDTVTKVEVRVELSGQTDAKGK